MPRLPTLDSLEDIDVALGTLLILRRQKIIQSKREYDTLKKRLVARRKQIQEQEAERERQREVARQLAAEEQRRKQKRIEQAAKRREERRLKVKQIGTTQVFASRIIKEQSYSNVSLTHYEVEYYEGRKRKFYTGDRGQKIPVPIYDTKLTIFPDDNSEIVDRIVKLAKNQRNMRMIKLYLMTVEMPTPESPSPIVKYYQEIVVFNSPQEMKENVDAKLKSIALKFGASAISVFLLGLDFISIPPPAGGCDGREHHHALLNIKVCSPKSKGNNCLLACMNIATKSNYKNDHTRKLLGFDEGTPITVDQIEAVAKFYNRTIKLFNEYGERLSVYNEGFESVGIVLYFGHYLIMEGEYKRCPKCYSEYLNTHTCNKRELLWKARQKGEKVVIPHKIKQETMFDKNNMIFYDIETFKNGNELSITPYAVSWWVNGVMKTTYGENCFNDFLDDVMKYENKIITAYNGASFDFHFLAKKLLERGVNLEELIMNGGSILSMKFGNNLKVWDICRFTLSSLKDACKAFGVSEEQSKTSFEHTKIRSWADVFKYEAEVRPYVQQDVIAMMAVFDGMSEMFYEMFEVHIVKYLTLSSLSYAIWSTMFGAEYLEIPNKQKYDFIRESLFGGRTYPMRREYTSSEYDDIMSVKNDKEALKQKYATLQDYVFVADVSSLYPASMVGFKYPIGKSKFILNPPDISKIGVYDVDIEIPKNLIVPILPRREKGRVLWDLHDRRGIYTSADLENAVQFGCKITKIHKGLCYEESSDVFSSYIEKCYKLKEDNDEGKEGASPVKRQIGKILMNALYGKTLEKARFTETRLCNNSIECWKFQKDYDVEQFVPMGDRVLMVGSSYQQKQDDNINKASQLGTFILSFSRRIMLNAMSAISPKLDNHFFYYTDTDSLHIPSSTLAGLKEKGWLQNGIGKLSDDCKGGRVIREINLAPKLYMYLCLMPDGSFKTSMKAKGIPKAYLSPELFEKQEAKLIEMPMRLKKVGYGLHTQLAHRTESAFSVLSIDMSRTFLKNNWSGMDFVNGYWFPKGYSK